jgi:DNA-binding NtrC family response regulator
VRIERVLIVEDNKEAAECVAEFLDVTGYKSDTVASLKQAKEALAAQAYDLVLLDIRLPDGDGINLLKEVREEGNSAAFIVMSGHATLEVAIESMRAGAIDYLIKPFNPSQLEIAVQRAESWTRLKAENAYLRGDEEKERQVIIGEGESMIHVRRLIQQVAPTDATVLIHGESGTGKELVAGAIQAMSPRRDQAYVRLNCAAIPENLMESEFFGHEKGAFTGALQKRRGRFEMADRGTLLLDEIAEIPLPLQAKLLRVLQEQEFERVGGGDTVKVDVRVLASTNRNLKEAVKKGEFREDLYFRLNVVPIQVPPLRERKSDIDLLINFFLATFARRYNKPVPTLSDEAWTALRNNPWPGNVRELQNCVERAVILSDPSRPFTARDFAMAETELTSDRPAEANRINTDDEDLSLDHLEKLYVEKALKRTGGNVTHAAGLLGISVRTLHYKLAQARAEQSSQALVG